MNHLTVYGKLVAMVPAAEIAELLKKVGLSGLNSNSVVLATPQGVNDMITSATDATQENIKGA